MDSSAICVPGHIASPDVPIYVDVSALEEKHLTGMGRFVAHLVQALVRLTPLGLLTTAKGRYIPVCAADLEESDGNLETWARRLLRRPRRNLDAQSASASAAIYTALRPGARCFRREVGILYDFTTLLLPWTHGEQSRHHFGTFFAKTAPLCDKLVAISQSTKRDAQWLCAANNDSIVVSYPGPSLCVHRHAYPNPVARRRNVILVVSAIEPRKNAPFLLDWFAATEALDPDMELWWVGPHAWWASRELVTMLKQRRSGPRGHQIRLLGKVSDRRLCQLYQQAAFTIYPSLYEGFGLPVLDALLHGAPVVCSYHSSLKELAGPGVFYFDPCDPATLDEACRALRTAQPLVIEPSNLRERFSWGALAQTVKALCA
ncbi:MAG TPA: glycosyltransferase family 1 protein [Gemmataceae bacterium]|nr:glycosyltransferase family 1 protein [Gemmataceae bacterium]